MQKEPADNLFSGFFMTRPLADVHESPAPTFRGAPHVKPPGLKHWSASSRMIHRGAATGTVIREKAQQFQAAAQQENRVARGRRRERSTDG